MKKIMIIMFLLVVSFTFAACEKAEHKENDKSTEEMSVKNDILETQNDDIYKFIDKETGVHYLVYSHKDGYGGMGGITPRLNADGSIITEKVEVE